MGPGDRARSETGGQLPFDLSWQTGVARYLPVRVPLVFMLKAQADSERLAWNNRIGRRDQLGVDVFFRGTEARQRLRRSGSDNNRDKCEGEGS